MPKINDKQCRPSSINYAIYPYRCSRRLHFPLHFSKGAEKILSRGLNYANMTKVGSALLLQNRTVLT
jgi:hypothetical protein